MSNNILYCKIGHIIDKDNDRGEKYKIPSLRCKICRKIKNKEYRLKDKTKISKRKYDISEKAKSNRKRRDKSDLSYIRYLKYRIKKLYNMSILEYETLIISQCNLCNICGIPLTKDVRPCIDHDHKTGKIRGILCNSCNSSLAMFKDDISNLNKAINYLKYA